MDTIANFQVIEIEFINDCARWEGKELQEGDVIVTSNHALERHFNYQKYNLVVGPTR